ncbi:glutamyl-tRNA reductase [Methanococcus aeolicus]|uniref:Glutamyl-tRNA reductase n=1 Tax=Methanococcus aeolicus (strain ATCC BAA-1280 / DSM 17508 / OCM 812 / Nankai-3) TaxID=419665 RepID=HEM1_META3|nr:glutamyl-tRNA reductase [Methanococcus aeolicus]A6UT22.1 RecName: Full=Glutamyl-tRNA reductase; Short=GluTR [Methanococcus aeolicus Nankai-3]ABR55644.1 Glutamyl-tRNA reductase [Methanococcus aeolicus Nankai-3]UXM85144.1 glutamyl-tRNA reductase [Methanococcus aeolicus]
MLLFRADYNNYAVSELQKLRFDEDEFYKKYDNCVLVQTCNRIEIYFDKNAKIIDINEFAEFEMIKSNNAIKHLLRTASGLNSMIVGEDQIIGQIKNSHRKAKELKKTTKYLDTIFLKAIHTGQKVRNNTKINKGCVSIGSAAVQLAEKTVGLNNKNILVVGAGEIATLVAKALIEKNIRAIVVSNRTYERAELLAKKLNGMAVHFDKLGEAINYNDIIICATGAPHAIIDKDRLKNIKGYKVLIDIANPRDVSDDVMELPNIKLYTIDDLKMVSEENLKKRKDEIPRVEKIIEEELSVLTKQLRKLKFENTIKNYDLYIENLRKREMNKALNMIENGKDPTVVLEKFSKVFANKLISDFVNIVNDDTIGDIERVVNKLNKNKI